MEGPGTMPRGRTAPSGTLTLTAERLTFVQSLSDPLGGLTGRLVERRRRRRTVLADIPLAAITGVRTDREGRLVVEHGKGLATPFAVRPVGEWEQALRDARALS